MRLTHIDLFSGIGGFALAAKWNGIETVQFVEIDKRCRDFLARTWPGVPIHDDIKTFHTSEGERSGFIPDRPVFLLTGGVPCQPASRAGKQRGDRDDRWLWPEAIRVLGEVKPRWALFENPPGIGDVGLAGILSDLEAQDYEVRVVSIPACAVNAPHRRERYWIVGTRMAHADEPRREGPDVREGRHDAHGLCAERAQGDVVNAESSIGRAGENKGEYKWHDRSELSNAGSWNHFVRLPCADGKVRRAVGDSQRMAHGLPVELLEELGAEGRQTPEECEVHRSILGALGNSIVPNVAFRIIQAILEADNERNV